MVLLTLPEHITKYVDVSPFSEEYAPIKNIPVGTCATAWTCPNTSRTYILVFGHALFFGENLGHSLLCPNQMRVMGHTVEEAPSHLQDDSKHGITVIDEEGDPLVMPLLMDGVISYLETHKPSPRELESCTQILMTDDSIPWDPHSPHFKVAEDARARETGRVLCSLEIPPSLREPTTPATPSTPPPPCYLESELRLNYLQSLMSTLSLGNDTPIDSRIINAFSVSSSGDTTQATRQIQASSTGDSSPGDSNSATPHTSLGLSDRAAARRAEWGPSVKVPTHGVDKTAESLASKWRIGLERAKATLRVTTQKGLRNVQNPLVRRMRTQRYRNKRHIKGRIWSDTMKFSTKHPSVRHGHKAAQVFTNGMGYEAFFPIAGESDTWQGLQMFINEAGILEQLVVDGAKSQGAPDTYKTKWQQLVRTYGIKQTWIQPHCWWQNRAELAVAEIRKDIRYWTARKNSPKRLWAYLGELIVNRKQLTVSTIPSAMGRTGFEMINGYTPDISMYMVHEWYDPVWWYDCTNKDKAKKLGRWLGPCGDKFGAGDCHYILHKTGKIHVTNSVNCISEEEWESPDVMNALEVLNKAIEEKIGDVISPGETVHLKESTDDLFADELIDIQEPDDVDPNAPLPDVDTYGPNDDSYDEYLNTKVLINLDGKSLRCKVVGRVKDSTGKPIGKKNNNPLLDTRSYHVQYPDGATDIFTANIIAENLYSSIDDQGHSFQLLDSIIGHEKDESAIPIDKGTFTTSNGQSRPKITTKGWYLRVSWRDGTTSLVRLNEMKDSFPIQTAEYAKQQGLLEEPAFAWWVHKALRGKARAIKAAKSKYWDRTHKYGVRVPKSIDEALRIDAETNTDFWKKAIDKEMKNCMHAFEFPEDGIIKDKEERQKITVHMIFDVKLIGLVRKARLVADGHKVDVTAKELTYSSVPSRDTVRLFFLLSALNGTEVLAADIQNAYLTAPINGKFWLEARKSDGFPDHLDGRPAILVRALYGLPPSGASFRAYLAKHLREMGFKSCKADPDLHMRVATNEAGEEYWEYVICYVDDLLVGSCKPQAIMDSISSKFKLKEGSVGVPEFYLGMDIGRVKLRPEDDKSRWSMSSTKYTKKAIETVETELKKGKYGYIQLPTGIHTPITEDYRPELDSTPELSRADQNYYQGLIRVLRWICELGRLDILMPVSLMSRYLVQAREGHLQQVLHIFAYLKSHKRKKLVFDDTYPYIDEDRFETCDWSEFYPEAREIIPTDAPKPLGKHVTMTCFVDADHAGCKATRRSHTGFIIYVNRAPIIWFSKRQTTVETSTYGSEIVAMRIAIEMIEGLRYKLRMMGIPLEVPTTVLGDNQACILNVTRPESPLKKKHNAVAYRKARESIAAGIIKVAKEDTSSNVADMFTKLLKKDTLAYLSASCMWADGKGVTFKEEEQTVKQ